MFVIDASVTLAWCFGDQASEAVDEALDRLGREDVIAPAIWPLEVANGLRTAERRGRLALADLPESATSSCRCPWRSRPSTCGSRWAR